MQNVLSNCRIINDGNVKGDLILEQKISNKDGKAKMASLVLLVDDEPDVEGLVKLRMRKQIQNGDYHFIYASDGVDALEKIREIPNIDVAVVDLNMPRMDGFSLLKELKEINPDMKTIIITAYGNMTNVRTAMSLGASDYITKPINFNDFENSLNNVSKNAFDIKLSKEIARQAELKLKDALKKEKDLNDMKSGFLSMVSHEYRNPLTIIQTSADLMRMNLGRQINDKQNNHLNKIHSAVKLMTEMLDDVVKVASIDSGEERLNLEEMDICLVLKTIIEEIKLIDRDKHDIKTELSCKSLKYLSDSNLLRYIFSNLISNAVKYSPEGSEIQVNLKIHNEHLIFDINDNGIGIKENDMNKIFQPFYRAGNVGKTQGTGLGLSIVKKSVEQLKGSIGLTSMLNSGTNIKVKLPLFKSLNDYYSRD